MDRCNELTSTISTNVYKFNSFLIRIVVWGLINVFYTEENGLDIIKKDIAKDPYKIENIFLQDVVVFDMCACVCDECMCMCVFVSVCMYVCVCVCVCA